MNSSTKKRNNSEKKERNDLTLEQKVEILDEIRRSKNVSATARMFKIGRRHAHKIKEQEEILREAYSSDLIPSTRKRLSKSSGGSSVTVFPKKKKSERSEEEDIEVVKIEVRSPEPQLDASDVVTQDTHAEVIDQSEGSSSAAAQSQSEAGDLRASEGLEENLRVSKPEDTITTTGTTSTTSSTTTQHHIENRENETVNTDSAHTEIESVPHKTEEDPVSDQSDDRDLSHHDEQPSLVDNFYDQMGPLSNMSLRTPGSVEVYEAAESLLSMDTVASPQTQSITESAAGCSRDSLPYNPPTVTAKDSDTSKGYKTSKGKVVGFVVSTTIKPFNSPPEVPDSPPEVPDSAPETLDLTGDSEAEHRPGQEETTPTPMSHVSACIRHPSMPNVIGCEHCLQMYCLNCFCELSAGKADCELKSCLEGKQHSTFPLEELTLRLKRKLLSNLDLRLRENQQVKSESEAMLQDKISKLHQQRDKEIELKAAEIRSKYKSHEDVMRSSFSEDTKVKELDNHINILQSKMRTVESSNHGDMLGFIVGELQPLRRESGKLELRSIGRPVDHRVEIINTRPPPTLGTLQKSITLRQNGDIERVCHYKGVTYIAYGQYIDSVDREGCVTNIITTTHYIEDVAVYNNKIFVLTPGGGITIYSLTGELITTWSLSHNCKSITVSGDLLVLCTYLHRLLLIYTQEGEKVRHVNISTSVSGLYPVDSKSVIVCDALRDILSRVDISAGADMWRRDDITPDSAVYDGHGNLLVWDYKTHSIQILDISSGTTLQCVSSADLKKILSDRSEDFLLWRHIAMTEDGLLTVIVTRLNAYESRSEQLNIKLLYHNDNIHHVLPA